jgi:hypothetical protein
MSAHTPHSWQYDQERREEAQRALALAKQQERSCFNKRKIKFLTGKNKFATNQ